MVATGLNYWAVLVAAAAYWLLGALWFSPAMFYKPWLRAIGKTPEQIKQGFSPLFYLWALVAAFLASYGIARICDWIGANGADDGALVGLLAGVCFVLPVVIITDVFEHRPKSLSLINLLYHVIGLILAGLIIGAWQ